MHYEYIAGYVDGILVFSKNPMQIIGCLKLAHHLQEVSLPAYFLVQRYEEGQERYARTYTLNKYQRVEELFCIQLKSFETPMANNDHPEMDDSGLMNHDDHSSYHIMLIGHGLWAVTSGRFDVMYAIQTMARFFAAPKQEHIKNAQRFWLP